MTAVGGGDRFGAYGGRYVPETLMPALDDLEAALAEAMRDPDFVSELDNLLATYVGRPSPLSDAPPLPDLVGARGVPPFVRPTSRPRAIPQYVLGYEQWKETMDTIERPHPRLFIGGNVRDGVSLPDCVKSGLKLADKVAGL